MNCSAYLSTDINAYRVLLCKGVALCSKTRVVNQRVCICGESCSADGNVVVDEVHLISTDVLLCVVWVFVDNSSNQRGGDNKQQTTNNKQQTTNNKQQTTNNKQQTTNNKQQTTNNKQQTTNNKQKLH